MLTEEDDKIRGLDIPERMQLTSVGLHPSPTADPDNPTAPFIGVDDLTYAANWMSSRISPVATEQFLLKDVEGRYPRLREQFLKAVEDVIRFVNVDFFEIPFIWAHRGDFLVHRAVPGSGEQDTAFLDQGDCWKIAQLSIKYRALAQRKHELRRTFDGLEVEDEYFEEGFDALKSVEEATDLAEWVAMKYSVQLEAIKADQRRAEEVNAEGGEGDVLRRKKRATRESAYDHAKRNVVSKLAEVSFPPSFLVSSCAGGARRRE